jgi:hypothetical protein
MVKCRSILAYKVTFKSSLTSQESTQQLKSTSSFQSRNPCQKLNIFPFPREVKTCCNLTSNLAEARRLHAMVNFIIFFS